MADPKDKVAYATAVEVDAIRRTVDQLIKKQDQTTVEIQANMDKILQFMQTIQIQQQLPEDRGSTVKGKEIPPSTPVAQPHPHTSTPNNPPQFRSAPPIPPKQFLPQPHTEKPNADHYDAMRNSRMGYYQQQSTPYWYNQSQYGGGDYYDQDTFDPEQDGEQHPWIIHDHEEPFRPPRQHDHHYRDTAPGGFQRDRHFYNPNNHNYNLQQQHRAIARGPKLTFPEFAGEDAEGWIRKAEKYFDMVGVPLEDKVKIAVLYVVGKA